MIMRKEKFICQISKEDLKELDRVHNQVMLKVKPKDFENGDQPNFSHHKVWEPLNEVYLRLAKKYKFIITRVSIDKTGNVWQVPRENWGE